MMNSDDYEDMRVKEFEDIVFQVRHQLQSTIEDAVSTALNDQADGKMISQAVSRSLSTLEEALWVSVLDSYVDFKYDS